MERIRRVTISKKECLQDYNLIPYPVMNSEIVKSMCIFQREGIPKTITNSLWISGTT